jgi:16S rRNA (adenine1518-N6/adenine1519-N6)-dimethyltransferase
MNNPSTRQTVSFLVKRFAEAGVEVKPKHGQNFLIDLNLLEILVDAADLSPADVVLEVGAGCGSLTRLLAERAGAVVSVEIDPQMRQLAAEELWNYENVILLGQDALRNKSTLAPQVLDAIARQMAARPGSRLKLVANLPYNVATPVVTNLLALPEAPAAMTVTIQKELADRITAAPGGKAYGALAVWVQSQCHVQILRTLPPTAFWPRPRVTSAIVQIRLDPALRDRMVDRDFFHRFIRLVFCHRRKVLRRVLPGVCDLLAQGPQRSAKAEVNALLGSLSLPPDARAEQLPVPTLIALGAAVRQFVTTSSDAAPAG